MPLDSSIYGIGAPRQRSAMEVLQELAAADDARGRRATTALDLQMGQAKLGEFQRQTGRANALQQFQATLAGKPDTDVAQAYRNAGYLPEAMTLEKGMLEREEKRVEIGAKKVGAVKDQAQAEKLFGEAQADALKRYRGALDYIDTPAGAQRWLQAQYADPLLASYMQALGPIEQAVTRIPADPQAFTQWRGQAAMGMEKWMQQQLSQQQAGETARHNQAGERLTASGQAVTMRGQNMTDARSRELNGVAKQAAADARQQAAADKSVTKFSDTLQKEGIPELETAIAGAEGSLGRYKPGEVPGIGALKNALPAFAMSDEGKDVRQSLAAVRNIVLSARSGAAVTDQELRRLVEEIGTGVGMSEADIRKGLGKVRQRLDSIKSNAAAGVDDATLRTYGERGGVPIKRGGPPAGGGWSVKEVR